MTRAAPDPVRYGGYDLARDDRDDTNRYGGAERAAANDQLPPPGALPYVRRLQRDLRELGFCLVGADDGVFGRRTEWAVREFQAYAKMANVARESAAPGPPGPYVDRLSPAPVPPAERYVGPVSGVANAATREALGRWLANRWRCPVVVSAHEVTAGGPGPARLENVWLHDEVTDTRLRMYARDFSRRYPLPGGRSPDDPVVLGNYAVYKSWSGPRSVPPGHTWPEAEMLPEHLVGVDLGHLTTAQRSTYKVVRAVSEVECLGFFDSLNAYDNALVSLGPCHWTLGIVDGARVLDGELCGYLSYLRYADPAAHDEALAFFGLGVEDAWDEGGTADGRALFQKGPRKYASWVTLPRDDGTPAPLPRSEAEGNYLKTWHWFYRFLMAGRTVEPFRRGMWPMARVRLRDILAAPWGEGVPDLPAGRPRRQATVGDVFTSERATALILRWHVRYPVHVVSGGRAGARLRAAFGRACIPASAGAPDRWTDAHETALTEGIMAEVAALNDAGFADTMGYVRDWPRWAAGPNPRRYALDPAVGPLAGARGSFEFEGSDLPPAPPYS